MTEQRSFIENLDWKAILDSIPIAIVISESPNGKFSFVNKRAAELYGFNSAHLTLEENVAKVKPKRLDGSPFPLNELPVYRALRAENVQDVELTIERPDGKSYPILGSATPVKDLNGKVVGAIEIFEDIAERKEAEEALRVSEERFSKAFYDSPHPMVIQCVSDQTFVDVNNAFLRLYGYSREELIGRNTAELGLDVDPEKAAAMYQSIFEKGAVYNAEIESKLKNGKKITLEFSSVVISFRGTPHLLTTLNDVTERKQNEEAIRKQADLIDLSPNATIVRKVDGTITFWSKGAQHVYGWTKEEAIGEKTHRLFETQFPEPFEEIMNKLTRDTFWTGQLVHRTKDGNSIIVQSYWLARFGTGRNIVEIFESNMDITELRKLQDKLQEYSHDLEKIAQERLDRLRATEQLATIGQVAGMVGHDIRNPLQAIASDVYLAKMELEERPIAEQGQAIKENVEDIEKQAVYIEKIVGDLQEMSKPLKPELVQVNICKAVPETVSAVQIPSAIERQMICDVPSLTVKVDLDFLRRIMVNLINNAVQAIPNGGRLIVALSKQANNAVITVQDTGVGMSKETQKKLFTPLFTTKKKGQGYGLVSIKRMVEALNGRINFESEEGKGTKFVIEFPLNP
jgi:PAS domain S-box-containing protein